MEQEAAYNLYHNVERFIDTIRKKGFVVKENYYKNREIENYKITKEIKPLRNKPDRIAHVGEIFNDRFLIIHAKKSNMKDSRFKKVASQLQKLAEEFNV